VIALTMDVSTKTASERPALGPIAATNGNAAATTAGISTNDTNAASELARFDATINVMLLHQELRWQIGMTSYFTRG
jgi:hypothetical protein